jgi:hypothetical protein
MLQLFLRSMLSSTVGGQEAIVSKGNGVRKSKIHRSRHYLSGFPSSELEDIGAAIWGTGGHLRPRTRVKQVSVLGAEQLQCDITFQKHL